MERSEISTHEISVFTTLKKSKVWLTSAKVAELAKINHRTARAHLAKLAKLGLVDTAEVFPGHRYKLSPHASKRNAGYLSRIEQAIAVFKD